MQRSLLSFFTRGPELIKGDAKRNIDSEKNNTPLQSVDLSDDDRLNVSGRRKRLLIDSSDEENVPESELSLNGTNTSMDTSFSKLSDFTCSPARPSKISENELLKSPVLREQAESEVATSTSNAALPASETAQWEHLSLAFLQPNQLRDSCNRRPDHPDYDKSTLRVPNDFLSKQTPAMRQWWELKSLYADTVLFFKMGKFYEMYHMDAVIGVEHLGLLFMKGSSAHCGFPEVTFTRNAEVLIKKGFKVARVEQTESVEAMTERTRGCRGTEKVVRREVCQLLTPGTCTAATPRYELSGTTPNSSQESESITPGDRIDSSESILFSVIQRKCYENPDESMFGLALLDASSGKIQVGQFVDDRHCSRLRTVIAQNFPSQVLVERGATGAALKTILATALSGVPVEYLACEKQFWSAKQTIIELESSNYFAGQSDGEGVSSSGFSGKEHWPRSLLYMLNEDDPLGRSVKPDYDLAVSCLGAIVCYLRHCLIDREVLSLGFIEQYQPPDAHRDSTTHHLFYQKQISLILDSITLANLDILCNNCTGTREGTLIERLDTCCTPFGRRLLRQWVTAPLCNPALIRRRQEAIDSLIENQDKLAMIRDYLRRLPDFERLLAKIHQIGVKGKDASHPDNRAILYEEVQYSRKSIIDFVATLNGFELAYEMIGQLESMNSSSPYLTSLIRLTTTSGGQFPSLSSKISFFKQAFDAEKAKRDGRIIPERGVDQDYDLAVEQIKHINNELETHLLQSSKRIGTRLSYWGTARNRFQIEVPDSSVCRVPPDWQLASQRKGCKRYRTPQSQDLLNQLMAAEERKDRCLRQIMHTLFSAFSEHFTQWHAAMRSIAELDCLIALSTYSMNASEFMCRPEFVDLTGNHGDQPFLEIIDGHHPCLINTLTTAGDLIPNDVRLGPCHSPDGSPWSTQAQTCLVTGPNMGGKSTLMRQTALLVILAHLGCRIPAKRCRLTPVDRIFSRLGATDRLLAGESTFMVELSETAAILRHLSPHSLVLMDELGRGTSTHDGAALASAVLHFLAQPSSLPRAATSGPRTLFSTHYHNLVDEVAASDRVGAAEIGLGHMACMVEEQSDTNHSGGGLENITFLYKFVQGACPKSYGFNAARLAHLPDQVIQAGLAKAREFERTLTTFSCLRKLLSGQTRRSQAQEWLTKLRNFDHGLSVRGI